MPNHYRGRFAPSPTGPLHFGSLVTAFGSFLRARHCCGEWQIRIEDIDTPRIVPGAAEKQLDTLRRFGLDWDGDVVWQSQRREAHRAALKRLDEAGLVFSCRCSRTQLKGHVHRRCVSGRSSGPAAMRLRMPDAEIGFVDAIRGEQRQNLARDVGDMVLWRRDGIASYQLAVVVDDAEQGITEVVRGADLLDSTPRQIYLQKLLGLPQPDYAHLPLILDAQHHKLGKSQHADALNPEWPRRLLRAAWRILGQPPEILQECDSLQDILDTAIRHFSLDLVPGCDQHIDLPPVPIPSADHHGGGAHNM